MSTLGERLIEAREARAFTQEQVAATVRERFPRARLTQQTIAWLETGRQKSSRYLAEIAWALHVHTDWLALGDGPRDREMDALVVSDPKLIAAMHLLSPMAEYQKDQAIKILTALSQPPNERANESLS